ncbi:MAG: M28 family metallopeptidase [Kofleriaceae bacterium]|nr:M28 family metallopeptidase [Kofleriaceae bacterium]
MLVVACGAGTPGEGLDVGRVQAHVQALAANGPRPGGSQAARVAAAYIDRELAGAGVRVERMQVGGVDLPAIEVAGRHLRSARRAQSTDDNLVVRFGPGSGTSVLVMAHYDTVGDSPGAIDNAAAVGLLIELARVLARAPPATPVMLVFTAEEEAGLVGAEAFAGRFAEQIDFAMALDLVGGDGDLTLNGASTLIGASELRWIAAAADRAGLVVRAPLAHRVISRWWPQAERSDHGAFTRRGVRAVHFYHRGHDGELIDLAYHSPRDVPARVEPAAVDEMGRLLRAIVAAPPPPHAGDGFWVPLLSNTVIPRWALLAFELVLVVLALGGLISARAAFVRGGLGLMAALVAFALATASTFAIEHVTAARPGAWLHAPLRAELALVLVLGGVLALVTVAARRVWVWTGELRFLVLAVAIPLALGGVLLALGAAELAWLFLLPAALIALAPRLGPLRVVAAIAPLLPAVLVLAPAQLREAAWNGFLPATMSLTPLVAAFLAPACAGVAWLLRRRGHPGPLGALFLPVGGLLAIGAGILVLAMTSPACSVADFNDFHLACEQGTGVR